MLLYLSLLSSMELKGQRASSKVFFILKARVDHRESEVLSTTGGKQISKAGAHKDYCHDLKITNYDNFDMKRVP